MRLLTVGNMYPPHHLGGYELMWRSWVGQARAEGHDVGVMTTDYALGGVESGDEDGVTRTLRWYWHEHEFPRLSLRERYRLEQGNLDQLERALDRDPEAVVWWAMGGMSMSMIEAVRRRGVPAVGVVVDDWLVYGPQVDGWRKAFAKPLVAPVAERLTRIPTQLDLPRSAAWLFVSEATRQRAIEGGADLDGEVIHAGIDPALFPAAPAREWGWRLLYLGRIDRRKGISTAIRALAELPPEATLEIVGGGDDAHRGELEELVRELGLQDQVSFAVYPRAEIANVYAASDAVLFPVLWEEPFGLVPLEAMAVGRPVVATGTGGSGEYLSDGENALVFQPRDDPLALAAAVTRLAEDPELRRRLVASGRATAAALTEDRFNSAVTAAIARRVEGAD